MFEPDLPPPYADPQRDMMSDLENSIEGSVVPGPPPLPDPVMGADPLERQLTALEASIEGRTIPPPFTPQLPFLPAEPAGPTLMTGPRNEGPPPPPESREKYWVAMDPPPAAKPHYTFDGLSQAFYHPRRGSGTGIRGDAESSTATRWCPRENQPVSQDTCQGCGHGKGDEGGCHYQSSEESGDSQHQSDKEQEE